MNIQGIQQSLNQIAQICNQLNQNEQANVSRLNQMAEYERSAAQQMQRCIQMINQISQQLQQISTVPSAQFTTQPGQFTYTVQPPMGGTGQFGQTGQQTLTGGQFGTSATFETAREIGGRGENEGDGGAARASGPVSNVGSRPGGGFPTFNTNKDIGQ
ncbi:hypothetical protein Tph_c24670 [Thermacetogenium phaeum DSM 12270]|uniref:Uncharacterized protein n=1 Tax=Thermacetogenium phaeum (strain ATCC BAA-254 / DSM 26808 / PB) TaxID=1089553 RepID=K4LXD8_THEPS|nr:hypothetical protein [Thermacetogenium phaeum]AFV12644.1 hypothetical protein Tph_c24670 [Thermacetogenium phaeum DSM 12270]